ncbi:hypothetical protein [Gillisia sp. JM1]|uniref:hypothetical protein n=1 Tax=Gillisia sp. JM1 TaxID=1283286 RepID=UPI000427E450|nr:hypothetical protein [Gillisia sp. JM1]
MYRGFNLNVENEFDIHKYHEIGIEIFNILKNSVRPRLKEYILPKGTIDGDKIMADWFPEVKSHLFLSHSHNDLKNAVYIAGALYTEFKILTFIDSTVWGYSNDLLKIIDDEYCKSESGETYDYQSRNYSTSHVHLMLTSALSKMIDNCEVIFFLNSPNSVSTKSITERTNSPWIFSEISTTKIIRKITPNRLKELTKMFSDTVMLNESQRSQLRIEYNLELSHFTDLNLIQFNRWLNSYCSSPDNALDELYRQHPIDSKFLIK